MFDLSFTEMLLAGVVALIVLGPERLPKVARTIGQWVGKMQSFANQIKSELSTQADLAEWQKIKSEVEQTAYVMRNKINNMTTEWDMRPAWEKLPEQKTPADFGIDETQHHTVDSFSGSLNNNIIKVHGINSISLRKQALSRKRDMRPRYRPRPKLRSRR